MRPPKGPCAPPGCPTCQPPAPTAAFLAGPEAARCWAGGGNPNSAPMKGALCAREGAALLLLLLLLLPWPRGCFPAWGWPHCGSCRETEAAQQPRGLPPCSGSCKGFSPSLTPVASSWPRAVGELGPGDVLGSPVVPQLVQGPWGDPQGSGSGKRTTRTEGHHRDRGTFSPVSAVSIVFSPAPLPASVSPSPWESCGCCAAQQDPDHPGGGSTHVGDPGCPTAMAEVPWEGDAAQHPPFCASLGRSWQERPSCSSRAPMQRAGWVQAGPPAGRWPTGCLALAQPRRAAGGLFSSWTGRRMNSITGSRFYSTCQGA